MKFGVELSFLPKKTPLGFSDYKESARIAAKLFAAINKSVNEPIEDVYRLFPNKVFKFFAYNEFFQDSRDIIEIKNGSFPFDMGEFSVLKCALENIFLKTKKLGLTGRFSRQKKGVRMEYPDAGFHVHHSMDVFPQSCAPNFLEKLSLFEENLYNDYANRPYIRWLFAQWFDNDNSTVIFNYADTPKSGAVKYKTKPLVYNGCGGIAPRFAGIRKATLPTFEHRYFGATNNAQETMNNLHFVNNWVKSVAKTTEEGVRIPVNLTRSYFTSLKNTRFAWREISEFLKSLGLDNSDYRDNFERNYMTRMKFGEML